MRFSEPVIAVCPMATEINEVICILDSRNTLSLLFCGCLRKLLVNLICKLQTKIHQNSKILTPLVSHHFFASLFVVEAAGETVGLVPKALQQFQS